MANETMLVIDDTLVLINLSPGNHRIPAHGPNGEPIHFVGKNAVLSDYKTLIVEEGIEEVQPQRGKMLELPTTVKRCFCTYPSSAATIRIWRRLPKQRWQELLSYAVRTADGRRIFTCPLDMLGLSLHAAEEKNLIKWVPEDANELICAHELISKKQQMNAAFSCVGIRKNRSDICPINSLVELARSGRTVQLNPEAEAMSDSFLRSTTSVVKNSSAYPLDYTYVMMADEPIACRGTTELLVRFTLQKAIWYYCSTVPVTYRGHQYYIGCLNELLSLGIHPYHRQEVAVFSGDGLVSDRNITEAVYDKFLLMSFM